MSELSSQPTSIQSAYGWHSDQRLFVNRRYQRKLVWTLIEKQKLVESIMKKYPVPAILLADTGHYEIIDGLQRLNAIISFIEGRFPTLDGRYFDISLFPTAAANFAAGLFTPVSQENLITAKEVSTILDYSLAFSIMRDASDDEVNDVFDRINSYGHRLSDQERRQAGIQNDFSNMVRDIACKVRGDVSQLQLPLDKMPEISIDLPMTKHGYDIKADEVFWVKQGILKSTDLRDSMDEQCIADIAASIISGTVLERSKDALDKVYEKGSEEEKQLLASLSVYGVEKFGSEFGYCIQQLTTLCCHGDNTKLRSIIYADKSTNAFPAIFSVLFIAFHELFIKEQKSIGDIGAVRAAITDLKRRIETSRKSTSHEERRKNINTIKGLISPHFIDTDPAKDVYSNHSAIEIDNYIRSKGMELSRFELKQGVLSLGHERLVNNDLLDRLVETACGIANNGLDRGGQIILGVADKEADANRINEIDGVIARKVGDWHVVGINREARILGITLEKYHNMIRQAFEKSELSQPTKSSILSSIDYNAYYGLGVIVISIPPQKEPTYVGESMFWRDGDNTKTVTSAKQASDIGRRF